MLWMILKMPIKGNQTVFNGGTNKAFRKQNSLSRNDISLSIHFGQQFRLKLNPEIAAGREKVLIYDENSTKKL